jgi:carbohydrate-selective porin OprB
MEFISYVRNVCLGWLNLAGKPLFNSSRHYLYLPDSFSTDVALFEEKQAMKHHRELLAEPFFLLKILEDKTMKFRFDHPRLGTSQASAPTLCWSVLLLLASCYFTLPVIAQTSDTSTTPNFINQKYLAGDWGGARTSLSEQKGVNFDFFLMSDLLANPKGGNETAGGWHRVRGTMDVDFGKLAHIHGLSFHITGLWQGGANIGADLGSISNPSGLVSANAFRLDSFWFQQTMLHDKVTLQAGQIAGMDFYGVQEYGGNYLMEPLDYAFGNTYTDFESYDPATTPAAQIKIAPIKQLYFRGMIQAGPGCNSPASSQCYRNQYANDETGTHYPLNGGGVWLNEVGYLVDQSNSAQKAKHYPGVYKVGATYNGTKFTDPVTNIASNGNYLVYFMTNQAIFRPRAHSTQGLDVHFAMDFAPASVNRVDKEMTAGAIYRGLVPKRDKDALDFGVVYNRVSDNFNTYYNKNGMPVLGSEKAFEINYLAQITPWLYWQPVVQIYKDLGANPAKGTGVVAGFRTKVTF